MALNFIDLFCGAGGFSKGFEMAGLKCIGAIDNFPKAAETHECNLTESYTACEDIRNVSPQEFRKGIGRKKVHVIIGGPPCPTFSTIGHPKIQSLNKKKNSDISEDSRNELFMDFIEYVKYFKPELFIIENVPNFITKYKGQIFERVLDIIEEIGIYEVHKPVQVLNSVHFGVPQTRRRMFLVGHKKKYKFNYPGITHYHQGLNKKGLQKFIDVKSAISDLPNITDNWRIDEVEYSRFTGLAGYQKLMRNNNIGKTVKNNICRMSNPRAKKVFKHMKQGSKYMDLPKQTRKILPFREDIFHDRLKRLDLSKPSWTVIAHIGMDGYMYIHPTELRTLSVREAARLQSFPDDFIFCGNQMETYWQVGNAVPPLMAQAIGKSVLHCLN